MGVSQSGWLGTGLTLPTLTRYRVGFLECREVDFFGPFWTIAEVIFRS